MQVAQHGELGRVAWSALALWDQQLGEAGGGLAMAAAGLAAQTTAQPGAADAARRQQVDADARHLTAVAVQSRERGGERGQWVRIEREPGERLDARLGEDQLGAGHLLARSPGAAEPGRRPRPAVYAKCDAALAHAEALPLEVGVE